MEKQSSIRQFNDELQKMLDKVAPEAMVKFAKKPIKSWFNKYIRDQRKIVKKKTDCVWRKCRKQHQWQAYTKQQKTPQNSGLTSTLGTKEKLSKTQIVFGESTDNNINGKITQKIENIQLTAYLPKQTSHIKPNK